MDKNEIRDQMIDSIVNFIYPEGRHINYQYLLRHIMNEYKLQLGENEWRVFYNSLMEDLQNGGDSALLVKNGSLIGLTELGREMGKVGGYTKFVEKRAREERLLKFFDITEKFAVIIGPVVTLIGAYATMNNVVATEYGVIAVTAIASFTIGLTTRPLIRFLTRRTMR